jgi:predicted MFS family arabinose efflux permease
MHEAFSSHAPSKKDSADLSLPDGSQGPWWTGLTSYHWFVLLVAALGWLFDCMDQQLFLMARVPALKELLPDAAASENFYAGLVTAIFIAGWATGGLIFGVLGDRIGRARVMMWTILIYSVCTGLTAFSFGVWDFALYRFLTGLGVGGEFAVGVALVAEAMPDRARPFALALLQALSAIGNVSAALISMGLGGLQKAGYLNGIGAPWQLMFVVGTVPALLALLIRRRLQEPERWRQLAEDGSPVKRGSLGELFSDPRWRRNALVGFVLACSGAIGLWAIGFFSFDLIDKILSPTMSKGDIIYWKGVTSLVQNAGSVLGVYFFSILTFYSGRRPAFAVCFVGAILATAGTFWYLHELTDIYWMIPIMGFWQLSLFGGFAIYFPELFPTRLRSTGTSFCYNVGRYGVAVGVLFQGSLTSWLAGFGGADAAAPLRYAGVIMCGVFVFGLLALPFAPETRGRPLPE